MPSKKIAKIDIVKAAAGVTFATLAAIGGAIGNSLLAGLAAIPAAGLASHSAPGDQLTKLKARKEKYLEISPPSWWMHDIGSWQNLCSESERNLPRGFQMGLEAFLSGLTTLFKSLALTITESQFPGTIMHKLLKIVGSCVILEREVVKRSLQRNRND